MLINSYYGIVVISTKKIYVSLFMFFTDGCLFQKLALNILEEKNSTLCNKKAACPVSEYSIFFFSNLFWFEQFLNKVYGYIKFMVINQCCWIHCEHCLYKENSVLLLNMKYKYKIAHLFPYKLYTKVKYQTGGFLF